MDILPIPTDTPVATTLPAETSQMNLSQPHPQLPPEVDNNINSPDGRCCVICFSNIADVRTSPCQHNVCCSICLQRLLENTHAADQQHARCPVCRAPIHAAQQAHPPFKDLPLPPRPTPPHPPSTSISPPSFHDATNTRPPQLRLPQPTTRRRPYHPTTRQLVQQPSSAATPHILQQSHYRHINRRQFHHPSAIHNNNTIAIGLRQALVTPSAHRLAPVPQTADAPALHVHATGSRRSILSDSTLSPATRVHSAWPAWTPELPTVLLIGQSRRPLHAFIRRLHEAVSPQDPHHPNSSTGSVHSDRSNPAPSTGNAFVLHGVQYVPMLVASAKLDQATIPVVLELRPRLVVLFADLSSLASFEGCVQCDLQLLSQIPALAQNIVWVLVKQVPTPSSSNPRYPHPSVDHADILAAKHYISIPRTCFFINVDARLALAELRDFDVYLQLRVNSNGTSQTAVDQPHNEFSTQRGLRQGSSHGIRPTSRLMSLNPYTLVAPSQNSGRRSLSCLGCWKPRAPNESSESIGRQ